MGVSCPEIWLHFTLVVNSDDKSSLEVHILFYEVTIMWYLKLRL
jgi:hypothetical protein